MVIWFSATAGGAFLALTAVFGSRTQQFGIQNGNLVLRDCGGSFSASNCCDRVPFSAARASKFQSGAVGVFRALTVLFGSRSLLLELQNCNLVLRERFGLQLFCSGPVLSSFSFNMAIWFGDTTVGVVRALTAAFGPGSLQFGFQNGKSSGASHLRLAVSSVDWGPLRLISTRLHGA